MKNIEISKTNEVKDLEKKLNKIVEVPLGAALPTFPSLGGYKCEALEVSDSNGFVLCNGQEIKEKESVFFGKKVPNLNANNFLKGSIRDNTEGGNKLNKVNYDHTHNYAHTHQVSNISIKQNGSQKTFEIFSFKNSVKDKIPNPDFILQYTGINSFGGSGDVMRLISAPVLNTSLFTSGVYGDSVNDVLGNAKTSNIVENSTLNIEPQNITTIFIIRVK